MRRHSFGVAFLFLLTTLLNVNAGFFSEPETLVTCGSIIKLQHSSTKYRLHSHEVAYGSGSGQQSVTSFEGSDDANSYWVVTGPNGGGCAQGTALKTGDVIRLQHMGTRKWLHSHLHKSPLSGNQEVSCYGGDTASDTGDHWKLDLDKASQWTKDSKMRLAHVDTGAYLGTHDKKFNRPIAGQQEVYAKKTKEHNGWWLATEGVYFPIPGSGNEEEL
eukprot:CAMPEP_0196579590 /NCGR_PEP_ID=MMETSP1081-20130531/23174_1 /TAXON_ID=36882 /ORGANISM="Pyramimonas amylifera, Strain CCMP720" /LENGTH=216 /DNA_ID=CAMNT_0041899219 /DNA_START=118 /DNA_END=768 /DNA_ORIENTATION=-